jgi:hypothetical protein
MAYSRRSSSRRSRAIISAIIALGWSSSPAIPATGSIDNVSQDMKTKVGNYIKTATYYTITNATTPAVVSDPKTGAIYTLYILQKRKWRRQPLPAAPRRRRQDVFSDPVRVNDKERQAIVAACTGRQQRTLLDA